jgi:hypothetical protein
MIRPEGRPLPMAGLLRAGILMRIILIFNGKTNGVFTHGGAARTAEERCPGSLRKWAG